MRINEDYLDKVSADELDDEIIADEGLSQRPLPNPRDFSTKIQVELDMVKTYELKRYYQLFQRLFENYRYVTECSQVRLYGSDSEDDSENNDVTDYYLKLFSDERFSNKLNKTTLNIAFNHPGIPLSGALKLVKSVRNIFNSQEVDVFIILVDTVNNQWYSYHTMEEGTIDAVYEAVYKKPEATPQNWAYERNWQRLLTIARYFQITDAVEQAEMLLSRSDIDVYEDVFIKRCKDHFGGLYPQGMWPVFKVELPQRIMNKFLNSNHHTEERFRIYRSGQVDWCRATSITDDIDIEKNHLENVARIVSDIQQSGIDFRKFGIYYNIRSKVLYFIGVYDIVEYVKSDGQLDCAYFIVGEYNIQDSVTSTDEDRVEKLNKLFADGLTVTDYRNIWKLAKQQIKK